MTQCNKNIESKGINVTSMFDQIYLCFDFSISALYSVYTFNSQACLFSSD